MESLIALFREQNAVLAGLLAAPGEARDTHLDTGSVPRDSPDAAGIVRAEVARVSGFPAERLADSRTLGDSLGFDSLMLTDLFTGLARKIPGTTVDPALVTGTTTLGDVIAHFTGQRSDSPAEPITPAQTPAQFNPDPGAANKNASFRDALAHLLRHEHGEVGIVDRFSAAGPLVEHVVPLGAQHPDDLLLQVVTAMVAANGDSHGTNAF